MQILWHVTSSWLLVMSFVIFVHCLRCDIIIIVMFV